MNEKADFFVKSSEKINIQNDVERRTNYKTGKQFSLSLRNILIGAGLFVLILGGALVFVKFYLYPDSNYEIISGGSNNSINDNDIGQDDIDADIVKIELGLNGKILFRNDGYWSNDKDDVFVNYIYDPAGNESESFDSKVKLLFTSKSKYFHNVTFSNDGSKIVFTNLRNLFMIDSNFKNLKAFKNVLNGSDFIFSPDNNSILFQTDDQKSKSEAGEELIFSEVNFDQKISERTIKVKHLNYLRNVKFTPDGKYFLYKLLDEIIVVNVKSGKTRYRHKINNLHGRYYVPFAISPSGKTIAYLEELKDENNNSTIQLQTMTINGRNKKLLYSTKENIKKFLVWSPDEKFILFSTKYGNAPILKLDVKTLKIVKMFDGVPLSWQSIPK